MQAEQIAQSQLDGGERLLWSGTPSAGGVALGALPAALFGIPFSGFAVFWICTAYSASAHVSHAMAPFAFFPLFGIPFLLIGLGMLTSPLWAWLTALKTVYAVTDKRVMIITGLMMRMVQSYGPSDIGDLTHVERADGRGSLIFGAGAWNVGTVGGYARVGSLNRLNRVTLVGIPDVREVEHLIRANLMPKAA
jgi:hypothetical protein